MRLGADLGCPQPRVVPGPELDRHVLKTERETFGIHPKGAPEYALTNSGELRNYVGMPKDGPIPDSVARQLKHGYYAAISFERPWWRQAG